MSEQVINVKGDQELSDVMQEVEKTIREEKEIAGEDREQLVRRRRTTSRIL